MVGNRPFFCREFPSTKEAIPEALESAVQALIEDHWVLADHQFCARLCLEEALVNAVVHGNQSDPQLTVRVEMARDGDSCRISVYDQGPGFDPSSQEMPDCTQQRGRGVGLIKYYMDDVSYNAEKGCLEMVYHPKAFTKENRMEATHDKPLVSFEQRGAITVGTISASEMLDTLNVSEFGQQVLAYVQYYPGIHLLLNLRHVNYVSSAALTELLRIREAITMYQGGMRLCGVAGEVWKIFEITNLSKHFAVLEAEEVHHALKRYEQSLENGKQDKVSRWEADMRT